MLSFFIYSQVCNTLNDCSNGEDEDIGLCTNWNCSIYQEEEYHQWDNDLYCIPHWGLYDGHATCNDETDGMLIKEIKETWFWCDKRCFQ